MAQPIETQMLYLQRLDKYKAEKPFEVAFNVSEFGVDAVQTSVCLAAQPVKVVDARSTWGDYRMDKHGFEFHRLATALKGDDFEDERLIREIYFPEVEAFLYQTIGKKLAHVLIFHHQVRCPGLRVAPRFGSWVVNAHAQRRKRSETFPHIDPGNTKYFQPIPRVHCGSLHPVPSCSFPAAYVYLFLNKIIHLTELNRNWNRTSANMSSSRIFPFR